MYRLILLHYPVGVWPYAGCVIACESNEVIVKQCLKRHFCIWKKHFSLFLSVGKTVCILWNYKRAKKNPNCIQLVLATQHMCVQPNKAKRFQLLSEPPFFENVIFNRM